MSFTKPWEPSSVKADRKKYSRRVLWAAFFVTAVVCLAYLISWGQREQERHEHSFFGASTTTDLQLLAQLAIIDKMRPEIRYRARQMAKEVQP